MTIVLPVCTGLDKVKCKTINTVERSVILIGVFVVACPDTEWYANMFTVTDYRQHMKREYWGVLHADTTGIVRVQCGRKKQYCVCVTPYYRELLTVTSLKPWFVCVSHCTTTVFRILNLDFVYKQQKFQAINKYKHTHTLTPLLWRWRMRGGGVGKLVTVLTASNNEWESVISWRAKMCTDEGMSWIL